MSLPKIFGQQPHQKDPHPPPLFPAYISSKTCVEKLCNVPALFSTLNAGENVLTQPEDLGSGILRIACSTVQVNIIW